MGYDVDSVIVHGVIICSKFQEKKDLTAEIMAAVELLFPEKFQKERLIKKLRGEFEKKFEIDFKKLEETLEEGKLKEFKANLLVFKESVKNKFVEERLEKEKFENQIESEQDLWDSLTSLELRNGGKKYQILHMHHGDWEEVFAVALHVERHTVTRSTDRWPRKLSHPSQDEIKEFLIFLGSKGILAEYGEYQCLEGGA